MKVGISRAATELGVSRDTLRRWEAAGKIKVERTPSGHRRYDLAQLRGLVSSRSSFERITIAYASVGSGMNYRKSGFRQLIQRICQGDIERLVMTHRCWYSCLGGNCCNC